MYIHDAVRGPQRIKDDEQKRRQGKGRRGRSRITIIIIITIIIVFDRADCQRSATQAHLTHDDHTRYRRYGVQHEVAEVSMGCASLRAYEHTKHAAMIFVPIYIHIHHQ